MIVKETITAKTIEELNFKKNEFINNTNMIIKSGVFVFQIDGGDYAFEFICEDGRKNIRWETGGKSIK